MGDAIKKTQKKLRGVSEDLAKSGLSPDTNIKKKLRKKSSQIAEKPARKGATSMKRDAANLQAEQIAQQQQTELLRRREAEGEIAKRKGTAFGKASGRRSLIRSAPTGLATTLGG